MNTSNSHRLLSRAEVAGRLGISPETVTLYVEDGRLPAPSCRLGKTASTDRWHEKVIIDFISPSTDPVVDDTLPTTSTQSNPLFYSIGELAKLAEMTQSEAFRILVQENVLQYDLADAMRHYRPTEEYFEKGYFWRIEKHSPKKRVTYFQTVVTPWGKDPIVSLLRIKKLYNIVKSNND